MRTILLSALIFLSLLLGHVSADTSTGNTVINATITGVMELNLSLAFPEIVVAEDYYFFENLTVFQKNYNNVSVYLNKSDSNNLVKFVNKTGGETYYQDDYNLYLPTDSYENVTLRIYVPPGQGFDGGTYNIPLYAYSLDDYRTNTTTMKIHVNNTNPIDDIEIVNIDPSSLYSGEALNVNVSIHKISPAEATDIQICYCINSNSDYLCGPSYNNYGCEWKAIITWLNYTKTVVVSENPGTYYFIVAVKYPNDENIKRANSPQFYVKSTPTGPTGPGAPSFAPPSPQPKLIITASDYIESFPGEGTVLTAKIENTGNSAAFNTTLKIYGLPETWASITPAAQDIAAGGYKNYSISISLPETAFEQIYSLSLIAKSGSVEAIKIITLTVGSNLEKQARFLLGEAQSKKKEAKEIIDKANGLGMNTSDPEKNMSATDIVLNETQKLFESGRYNESIGKAKQTIEGYKSVIDSVNKIVERAYIFLLNEVMSELGKIEPVAEEKDVLESINYKINQSSTLRKQERFIEAYLTLLEAKQLLNELKDKMYFKEMTQNILIISVTVVIIVVVSMFLVYRKKTSKLLKTIRIEEHKKNLKSLFKREVRPSMPQKERKIVIVLHKERPLVGKVITEEARSVLESKKAVVGAAVKGAKEVHEKAKKIEKAKIIKEEKAEVVAEKPKEKKPEKFDKEKIEEIYGLLETGAKLVDTDPQRAKEIFLKIREIYNSMSPEEKKIIDEEVKKVMSRRK